MTTLEKDMIRLNLELGPVNLFCQIADLDWPPPERLTVDGSNGLHETRDGDDPHAIMKRVRMSKLTDEEADHPRIARGAEYVYELPLEERV